MSSNPRLAKLRRRSSASRLSWCTSHTARFIAFSLYVVLTSLSSATEQSPARIRLDVLEPEDRSSVVHAFPISVGLVFPKGELSSVPGGRIVDDQGRPVVFEAEATGWWDAEHDWIKWLLVHFGADTDRTYFFEVGGDAVAIQGEPIGIQSDKVVTIDTGPLCVTIDRTEPRLFNAVELHGRAIIEPTDAAHVLLLDNGVSPSPCRVTEWRAELEESTPSRATVKATGLFRDTDNQAVAQLDMRYQFHRDESFVRIYHTLTWMVQDVSVGVRALSLALEPSVSAKRRVQFGLASQDTAVHEAPAGAMAFQDGPEHFSIEAADGSELHGGRQLDGWFASVGDDGRAVSVALRIAWQTYPTALDSRDGKMTVHFWPQRAEPMSFQPRALMGDRIYFHPTWKRYPFAKEAGHFVNNYEESKGFMYTAEGAAMTHELVIGFHDDRTSRSPAELNAVTQRPIVLRQDPQSAMRVPFMGFDLMPCDPQRYPDIERAADWLGRLSMARWISENNYGLLRFGMVRWSKHGDYTYYRWMDNTQYDQQLIPWLLFMRGGDRRFFDDGEITSRYCMDMNVNHYNTRGSPTGYMATCGGALPFPNFAFEPWNMKGMKLHFLAYYYHLTGYKRAKEVMDEIIEGTVQFTRQYNEQFGPDKLAGGRENYNMNRFWATAYQETHDPEIATLARHSRAVTMNREYDSETLIFGGPKVYLYEGLVLQHHVFGDHRLRGMMVSHLTGTMLGTSIRGIQDPHDVIASDWAYRQTDNEQFAEIGWDLARGYADIASEIDLDTENVPNHPYAYCGNRIFRQQLMPMLVGASLGHRLNYSSDRPHWFRDLFLFLGRGTKDKPNRSTAYVRPRMDGDLMLRILARIRGDAPLTARALAADGRAVAELTAAREGWTLDKSLKLVGAKADQVYRVEVTSKAQASVLIAGPAQVVWHVLSEPLQANEPFSGGQSYTPQYVYSRATGGPVAYFNRHQRPYAIRDVENGELLVRGRQFTPDEQSKPVEAGRTIEFTLRGSRAPTEWRLTGVEPFIAATADDWFDPREHGWEYD